MATKLEPFDVGDEITVGADFVNAAGAATNPSGITIYVEDPDGVETTYAQGTLTNPTAGRWEKKVVMTKAGLWYAEIRGTGAIQLTVQGSWRVRESRFAYP